MRSGWALLRLATNKSKVMAARRRGRIVSTAATLAANSIFRLEFRIPMQLTEHMPAHLVQVRAVISSSMVSPMIALTDAGRRARKIGQRAALR